MTKITNLLLGLASIIAAGSIAYGIFQYNNIHATEVRHTAVQGCLETSTHTFEHANGATTVEPIESVYQKCLQLKNIQ